MDLEGLLQKYGQIIAEETNVKQIKPLEDVAIKRVIKPIGSQIAPKYGKDTGRIIALAKQWNRQEQDGKIVVIDPDADIRWILEPGEYEISREGLDADNMAAEDNVAIKLDTEITQDLYEEGLARQISRFLNQLRKDAGYNISDRIYLFFEADQPLKKVITSFEDFLKNEVLALDIQEGIPSEYDIQGEFEADSHKATFYLKK